MNFSNTVTPAGCSSLYVEVSALPHERYREEVLLDQVYDGLYRCSVLTPTDKILVADVVRLDCAYVLHDLNRAQALAAILPYLEHHNISSIGRYGGWEYSSMEGAMAQRLVRRVCSECKEEVDLSRHPLPDEIAERIRGPVYRGRGCEKCMGTGYYGRIGIFELLPVSEHIRELIMKRTGSNVIKEAAREAGMRTLREDGWEKVRAGITTVDEVLRVTKEDVSRAAEPV